MRTALLTGSIVFAACALLALPRALMNTDFVYTCLTAALAGRGEILVSPYFPPGYPLLVYGLVQCGLSALSAGTLLAALGTALSAACVSYCARLWQVPGAPAFIFGLLAASLPSLFIISLNPQLDALYTGLAAVLIAAAMRAFSGRHGFGVYLAALLPGMILLSLRWHAALLVLPIALALLFTPRRKDGSGTQALGTVLLLLGAAVLAGGLWLLYQQQGSLQTAAPLQIAAGAVYRKAADPEAAASLMYDDYARWLASEPAAGVQEILGNVLANWPRFLTRKAVPAGIVLFIIMGLIRRRSPPGSAWLLAFIPLYTLALSATYFTERASALPELCGLLLATAAASLAFPSLSEHKRNRLRTKHAGTRVDPALVGGLLSLLLLAGLGWNIWRELPILRAQAAQRREIIAAGEAALKLAGGERGKVLAMPHRSALSAAGMPYNIPAPSFTRMWLDDPRLAPRFDALLPRYDWNSVLLGKGETSAVLLSEDDPSGANQFMIEALEKSSRWTEQPRVGNSRIWRLSLPHGY
ncbi:hypothetical protein IT575_01575 [bacterium]|nr:hypothetical protein [bacterium]